jgi:hypothetical protein
MRKLLACVAAGSCLAALVAVQRLSAETKPAQVSALEGRAQRARGSGAPAPLALGAGVAQGDILTTEADSRLELKFADASVLRVGPRAKLQLSAAHFGGGPSRRQLTAKLFFGSLWAKVTSVIQGEQKFQIETENAVAGVRGTTFRVDARSDRSVLVRVYDGAVAVSKSRSSGGKPGERPTTGVGTGSAARGGRPTTGVGTGSAAGGGRAGSGREEVAGPEEVSRDQWEQLVGRQMELVIAADGTPGTPAPIGDESGDAWAKWNEQRDAAPGK